MDPERTILILPAMHETIRHLQTQTPLSRVRGTRLPHLLTGQRVRPRLQGLQSTHLQTVRCYQTQKAAGSWQVEDFHQC